jgi:hypothetical protein
VRWTFRATGLAALLAFIDPVFRLPVPLAFADGALALILLSAAPLVLASLWRRATLSPTTSSHGAETVQRLADGGTFASVSPERQSQ